MLSARFPRSYIAPAGLRPSLSRCRAPPTTAALRCSHICGWRRICRSSSICVRHLPGAWPLWPMMMATAPLRPYKVADRRVAASRPPRRPLREPGSFSSSPSPSIWLVGLPMQHGLAPWRGWRFGGHPPPRMHPEQVVDEKSVYSPAIHQHQTD